MDGGMGGSGGEKEGERRAVKEEGQSRAAEVGCERTRSVGKDKVGPVDCSTGQGRSGRLPATPKPQLSTDGWLPSLSIALVPQEGTARSQGCSRPSVFRQP